MQGPRLLQCGYGPGDFSLGVGTPDPSLKITVLNKPVKRQPVQVFPHSIGVFGPDGKPLHLRFYPEVTGPDTQIASCIKRFACVSKPRDATTVADFTRYAKAFIEAHFTPPTHRPSLEEWLRNGSYPGPRRRQLSELHNKMLDISDKIVFCDSFIKGNEGFAEAKQARSINALSDQIKVLYGPLFAAIDASTFGAHGGKWSVKHTDPAALPKRLQELFGDSRVLETDFSSMEAHHRGPFIEVIRHWALHMSRNFQKDEPRAYFRLLSRIMLGTNICRYSHVKVELAETLMSGASWTSSSNYVLNLLIMSYIYYRTKFPRGDAPNCLSPEELAKMAIDFKGIFEGDDGMSEATNMNTELVEKLGLRLKFEEFENFRDASFCGNNMSPDGVIMKDPKKVMSSLFGVPRQFAGAKESTKINYVVEKAKSMYHMYKNCPVVGPMSYEILRQHGFRDTRKVEKHLTTWEREQREFHSRSKRLDKPEISHASRLQVEKKFFMNIDRQTCFERAFAHKCQVTGSLDLLTPEESELRDHYIITKAEFDAGLLPPLTPHPEVTKIIDRAKVNGGVGLEPTDKGKPHSITKRERRARPWLRNSEWSSF